MNCLAIPFRPFGLLALHELFLCKIVRSSVICYYLYWLSRLDPLVYLPSMNYLAIPFRPFGLLTLHELFGYPV